MAGMILVVSFMAVGENNINTPILHNNNNKIQGIILNRIEGTLIKYLFYSLGPQA